MKIKRYMTGPVQVNTYLVYDEESKKGFIVCFGGLVILLGPIGANLVWGTNMARVWD